MRKISIARKLWLDARSRRGAITKRRRKLEHRAWIIARRASRDGFRSARVVELYAEGRTQYAIAMGQARPAPTRLSLGEAEWDKTINFISEVRSGLTRILKMPRNNARKDRRSASGIRINGYWDFSTINYIGLNAALALASQYDRIRYYRAFVPKAVNISEWNPSVVNILRSIGFFSLSGVEEQEAETYSYSTGILLRMTRCHNVNGTVIIEYLNKIGVDLTVIDPSLCDALMEAITNSVHHAWKYKELCDENTVPAWWISAYIRTEEHGKRKIVIMIYDHGASIPATLPRWEQYGRVARILVD